MVLTTFRWCNVARRGLASLTKPIDASAKSIRHLQFTKILPFEEGLRIQEKIARAQLDMKSIESKIKRKVNGVLEQNANSTLNDYERAILNNILSMKPNPVVLTFEFEPTYTGGKRIKKTMTPEFKQQLESFTTAGPNRASKKPKFLQVERGGQITFHGPGQMVAYIILDLKTFKDLSVKKLVCCIEKATINTLENARTSQNQEPLGLKAKTTNDTGVWTLDNKKIASLGIHIRRSITSHGVCINVNPDLAYLNTFEMCGLPNAEATSIYAEKPNTKMTVQDIARSFVHEFAKLLGIEEVERIPLEELAVDD